MQRERWTCAKATTQQLSKAGLRRHEDAYTLRKTPVTQPQKDTHFMKTVHLQKRVSQQFERKLVLVMKSTCSYSWNKSEQSINMNHKFTGCGLDVNKWSPSPLQMILVL